MVIGIDSSASRHEVNFSQDMEALSLGNQMWRTTTADYLIIIFKHLWYSSGYCESVVAKMLVDT